MMPESRDCCRFGVEQTLRAHGFPSCLSGYAFMDRQGAVLHFGLELGVIYAIIVEQSVGKLLLAGFLPGIASALIYAVLIGGICVARPEMGHPITGFTWKQRFESLPGTFPIIIVVAIIFGSLYTGAATPTEAAALSASVVFALYVYRALKLGQMSQIKGKLHQALIETVKLTVMIFTLIWGVFLFVRFLGFAGLPSVFADWVVNLDMPPIIIMICILLAYAVLGMFMDAIGMLILTLPVVYPAVVALGYDLIWFGIIIVKMAEICLITPPIGLNCFVVAGVSRDLRDDQGNSPEISLQDVFRGVGPFFVADVITVGVLLAFPQIVLWLPSLMG